MAPSFLNEVMSTEDIFVHIALSFFSAFFFFFFFQLTDDFNTHGWVEWVDATFPPWAKLREMPGNYLLDPRDLGKNPCQCKKAAEKTLNLTNKDRGSSGLEGQIHSLIPLSSILHGFHWALTDRVSYKDSIETSSLLWCKSSEFDKDIVTLLEQKSCDFDHQFGGERVSNSPPLTTLRLKENGSLTHFFQIKRNMQLHLIAGVSYAQLG